MATTTTFQLLENMAVLADAGVLRGQPRRRVEEWWLWSSRAWMAGTAVELLRLGAQGREMLREGVVRKSRLREITGEKGEREVDEDERIDERMQLKEECIRAQQQWRDWKSAVGIQLAYAPMTVHYSLRDGFLNEAGIGALGVVVGWLSFGRAWRDVEVG